MPSLTLAAGADHLVNSGSGANFNATEWGVEGVLEYALLEGGAKFASVRQALASARTQRRAAALTLDQRVRAALAQASGSYANIDFRGREVEAARRNYELVDASYVLGVASVLDILYAQSQLLDAFDRDQPCLRKNPAR